jgi:hypothetical protein
MKTLSLSLSCLALLAGLAAPSAARAQANLNEMRAAELFQMGAKYIQEKRFADAAAAFDRAYGYDPDPGLLINAAEAHDADLKYEKARLRYFQVATHPRAPEEMKAKARAALAEVEARILRTGRSLAPLPAATTTATTETTNSGGSRVTTTTTTTTVKPPTEVGTGTTAAGASAGLMPSRQLVGGQVSQDADRAYRLSTMQCYWNGTVNKFQSCSASHSWGGNANFDLGPGRSRAAGNGLLLFFQHGYGRKPFCSVEFQNIVALRRVDPRENAVYIYLHDLMGGDKDWDTVSTWVTVICHGVQ